MKRLHLAAHLSQVVYEALLHSGFAAALRRDQPSEERNALGAAGLSSSNDGLRKIVQTRSSRLNARNPDKFAPDLPLRAHESRKVLWRSRVRDISCHCQALGQRRVLEPIVDRGIHALDDAGGHDEWVDVEDYLRAIAVAADSALRWCGAQLIEAD